MGGGYAALAACWHLLQKNPAPSITLYIEKQTDIASTISTGLLHPYPGKFARRSIKADAAIQATLELLQIAEGYLQQKVYQKTGVLKIAIAEEQKPFFAKAATHGDAIWNDPELLIPHGITVFSERYIQGLTLACQSKGVKIERKRVTALADLPGKILVAAGAESICFDECKELPLNLTKGRVLVCRGHPVERPIIAGRHISPSFDPEICYIGSTYEREGEEVDPFSLKGEMESYISFVKELSIIGIKEGFRCSNKGSYLPLVKQLNERIVVFAGLGSRGLLYHALFAKELSDLF